MTNLKGMIIGVMVTMMNMLTMYMRMVETFMHVTGLTDMMEIAILTYMYIAIHVYGYNSVRNPDPHVLDGVWKPK